MYKCACAALCVFALGLCEARTTKAIDLAKEDMLLFWKRSNVPKCKPFTVFKLNCNQCVCGADGVSSCTRMYCGSNETAGTRGSLVIESPHLRENEGFNTEESDDSD